MSPRVHQSCIVKSSGVSWDDSGRAPSTTSDSSDSSNRMLSSVAIWSRRDSDLLEEARASKTRAMEVGEEKIFSPACPGGKCVLARSKCAN
jgi:hypothetical protein